MQDSRQAKVASHAEVLAGDWQRHQQALSSALEHAQLLNQQLDRAQLLSSESVRDRVAVRILQGPLQSTWAAAGADSGRHVAAGQQHAGAQARPAAAALLDAARLQHAEAHAASVNALASEVAALQVTAAALDADEDKLRRRFLPKPKSLAAVIQDDERLAGLTEAKIQAEVRAQAAEGVRRARLMRMRSKIASAHADAALGGSGSAAATHSALDSSSSGSGGPNTVGKLQTRQAVDSGSTAAASAEDDGSEAADDLGSSSGDEGDTDSQPLSGEASQGDVQPELMPQAADLPSMLHIIKNQRFCGRRNPIPLSTVVSELSRSLPQQQEQLALLKRVAAYTSARLSAQVARPQTYAGEMALTPQQRSIRTLAHDIIDDLVSAAMAHVAMRPSKAVVDLELAEWRVGQPAALAAISRHTSDGLLKEVVEELLAEMATEVQVSASAAGVFSMDMLVAAVAFSTGKFDLGFSAAAAPQRYSVGGVAREAALLRKVATHKSTAMLSGPHVDAAAAARAQQAQGATAALATGDVGAGSADQWVYTAQRDFAALDHAFSSNDASIAAAASSAEGSTKYRRSLYLAGLRGMLAEMRGVRPPGTPYGHTQQLTPKLVAGQTVKKATRLAVSRTRPPLAACAKVWLLRQGPLGRLEAGGWAAPHHMAVATKERAFWGKMALRGYLTLPPPKTSSPTAAPLSSLTVPPTLGSISCLSACPSGQLVAVGTDKGGLLVWDVSQDKTGPPVFQVSGSGQSYKHSWWKSWQESPQRPAITGMCWSADSFQLAALDASSNIKLWWMSPEQGEQGAVNSANTAADAKAVPAPQLAVVLTPLNVTLSGKMPIADEAAALAAQEVHVAAAVAAAAAAAGSKGGLLPRLGQWLGLQQPVQAANKAPAVPASVTHPGAGGERPQLSHQWHPVFHPARSPAGTQPTLVAPQVTGDVLSLTTALAEAAVQPGPATTAANAAVDATLAAAATAPATALPTAARGATGKGQVPAGAALAADSPGSGVNAVEQAAHGAPAADRSASAAGSEASAAPRQRQPNSQSSTSRGLANSGSSFSARNDWMTGQQQQAEEGQLPQAVVDYLLPPQAPHPDVEAQALYRCHTAPVVFLGFLSDDASLVSLDSSGMLVLWPQHPTQRCGFGWLKPRARWQLPRMLRTCQLRGGLSPFYPAASAPSQRGSSKVADGAGWQVRYVPDAQDAADEQQLRQDPAGSFLLTSRTPWLVRYLPCSSSAPGLLHSSSGVVRQVFHRPADSNAPGSRCVLVSSYDAATGALLMRAKQRCVFTKAPVKVVGAKLTPSKRELLVVCRVTPQPDDASALHSLIATTISLSTMKAAVPRIDLPDPTRGTLPPAFEITQPLVTTGSEYLLADLGCGVAGVFSLATGQLMRELRLHSMQASIPTGAGARAGGTGAVMCGMAWVQMTGSSSSSGSSDSSGSDGGAGRHKCTLLAAACVGGQHVSLVQLDVDGAAQQVRQEEQQQQPQQQLTWQQQQPQPPKEPPTQQATQAQQPQGTAQQGPKQPQEVGMSRRLDSRKGSVRFG